MPQTTPTITPQTFYDLGMWLSSPEQHTAQQLHDLLDEDARLPCIALANQYWLIGALTHSLKNSTVWATLDNAFTAYLQEMEDFNRKRSEGIKWEVIHACHLLSTAGIKVALLKGGANLFNGTASPNSVRFMIDIDVLVSEDNYPKALNILKAHGYEADLDEHHIHAINCQHAPPLYRLDGACCVELHRWVLSSRAANILSTAAAWNQAIKLPLDDSLTVWQLHPTHQFILSVAHSEISHWGYSDKVIDLRQLVNAQTICQRYAGDIDWHEVESHFSSCNEQPALYALLYAAKVLLNVSTPLDERLNGAAKEQFESCLGTYVKRQASAPKFAHLRTIKRTYSKESIHMNYGGNTKFWLLRGRLMHLKRHFLMATRLKYWKRFYYNLSRT